MSEVQVPIYCINLKKRKYVWDNLMKNDYNKSIGIQRFEGINGMKLEKHHKITRGHLGCWKSHHEIWKSIDKTTIILEDDIIIPDMFLETINNILEDAINLQFDIILLSHNYTNNKKESVSNLLNSMKGKFHGTQGYIITPVGAKKLCELVKDDYPGKIDISISKFGKKGLIDILVVKKKLIKLHEKYKKFSDTVRN